jgi:hypothetical protein
MRLTARQLNRATLARQLLLRREAVPITDALHRAVALQAQEAASPYIALWNRVEGFEPADLDAAFAGSSVVKATLFRITLHAVGAADYPAFRHAMVSSLRALRLHDRRFAETGLSIEEVDALVPDLLAYLAEPRTNAEVEAWLQERVGRPVPRAWWALRKYSSAVHAPTGAPWTFGPRPSYVAAGQPTPTGDPAGAVQHVIRRYLEGFGPATAQDIAQFTILRQPVVRAALDVMADELVTLEGPGRSAFYDVPDGLFPDMDVPVPPRLMAMWDSTLLAYADRSRVIPPAHRAAVIRRNGDVLPTLLVDGVVAGVWRPVDGGVEATAFEPLADDAWDGLAAEARALVAFLADRDPNVYRRYARAWDALPRAEVRVLPG